MKRWTYSYEQASVFSVECELHGFPHDDEHGNTQFENTHFDTESEAWERLLREAQAGISLGERSRVRAREELDRVTRALADAAEILARATRGFEARRGESEVSSG